MKRTMMFGVVIATGMTMMFTGCAQKKSSAKESASGLQRIHFDFDKSNIKTNFEPVLKSNAAWAQSHNNKKIVIEGHCDNRGSVEYNLALGDRRAQAAKNYLTTLGVTTNRLNTISYGEERPMQQCGESMDDTCHWQNRRAEFVAR